MERNTWDNGRPGKGSQCRLGRIKVELREDFQKEVKPEVTMSRN